MDFKEPPRSEDELFIWKVFVSTCETEVWQVVHRWIKKFGNPAIRPEEESYDDSIVRGLYREALRITFDNK